jgi:hypothetical protein
VYSTCIFCHTSLGANEAVEHFPVGRRLAFDEAKGRLWVVCKSCERWNLSPIDHRWEAIEECEKLFRDTKLRASTPNIGLARLKDGTTLVRIGAPQRPEMAAWRYGDQFRRRRTKNLTIGAATVVAAAGLYTVPIFMGVLSGGGTLVWSFFMGRWLNATQARVSAKGKMLKLNRFMLADVQMHTNEVQGFALEIPHWPELPPEPESRGWIRLPRFHAVHKPPTTILSGDGALNAARQLLPRINRAGAGRTTIADSVQILEQSRNAEHLFGQTAFGNRGVKLTKLPAAVRLALEMSLHEEDERRALEGELSILEDRWREAEEVAGISDDMFLPAGVSTMLDRLKGRSK